MKYIFFSVFLVLALASGKASAQTLTDYSVHVSCSGTPWYDVRCAGAVGDDVTDDSTAINAAVVTAVTNNYTLYFPRKTFKCNSPIVMHLWSNYQFTIIANGSALDCVAVTSTSALVIFCDYGGAGQYFRFSLQGELTVAGSPTANAVTQIGLTDLSDGFYQADINLTAINYGTANTGSGCQISTVRWSRLHVNCAGNNGGGLALVNLGNSTIVGRMIGGIYALAFNQNISYLNTFESVSLTSASGDCIQIATSSDFNTFLSPDVSACVTGVDATSGLGNTLVSPYYITSIGTNLDGITIVNDVVANAFASVPSGTGGLPQLRVGGAGQSLAVSSITLAPIAAPGAPSATDAWTLWDNTSDAKVKIIKSTGTVRTLAQ